MREKIKLFCLHFAGGNKYAFNNILKLLPKWIEHETLELPGRGGRIKEELLTDINQMTDDLFNQISGKIDIKYAFYGHSMGALLCYLLTKKIQQRDLNMPDCIILTGCGGPSTKKNDKKRHLLTDYEFKREIENLGGSPKEILYNSELMDFFLPILRADFQAIENYRYMQGTALKVPLFVGIGENESVTLEEAKLWERESYLNVELQIFPGNHFFIFDKEKLTADFLEKNLLKHQTTTFI